MVRKAFVFAAGISAALLASAPQVSAQKGAPRVRVTSQPYTSLGNIEPSVSLSEPAYILAVAVDKDGHVSVLSPVEPNEPIRFEATKSLRLPEFFSGFSTVRAGYYDGYGPAYASYIRSVTDDYSAGSVLVVASRTQFNFAAISDGPFWNEEAIKKLVRYRDPSSAVYALGKAITSKGQSFGHDYLRFGGSRYRVASADPCSGIGSAYSSYYGYGLYPNFGGYTGLRNSYVIVPATATSVGYQLMSIGTDACGRIRYVVVPYRVLPPNEPTPVPVDSTNMPQPALRSVIAAAPGTYTGEAAIRVFESVKNRNTSDTYAGLPGSPVLRDKEDRRALPIGKGVTEPAESLLRARENSTQIERAPVLRQAEPRQERTVVTEPVTRTDPVMRSAPTMTRETKPAEVRSGVKDN